VKFSSAVLASGILPERYLCDYRTKPRCTVQGSSVSSFCKSF